MESLTLNYNSHSLKGLSFKRIKLSQLSCFVVFSIAYLFLLLGSYQDQSVIKIVGVAAALVLLVFLNTTLEDSYPMTNLEAVACGTPVLTFRTGGSPEIVDDTGYGIVIDRDVYSISSGIKLILKSGKKQLNSCIDFLDSKKRIFKYITLYKDLVDE